VIKNPRERLILALDVASADEAKRLIERVEGEVEFVKIGLELFTAAGPSIVRWFIRQHFRVFLDLKLLDIGETVKRTTAVAAGLGVTFFTVHARSKILHAAVEGRGEAPMKILAITVLTNLAEADLREAGVTDSIPHAVLRRAQMAAECKADGVIASGVQTNIIRKELGASGDAGDRPCRRRRLSGRRPPDPRCGRSRQGGARNPSGNRRRLRQPSPPLILRRPEAV